MKTILAIALLASAITSAGAADGTVFQKQAAPGLVSTFGDPALPKDNPSLRPDPR